MNTTSTAPPRDVGHIVSRWNLQFYGDTTENIDTFLRKIEEGQAAANLSESELLASLSLVMKGTADIWLDKYALPIFQTHHF